MPNMHSLLHLPPRASLVGPWSRSSLSLSLSSELVVRIPVHVIYSRNSQSVVCLSVLSVSLHPFISPFLPASVNSHCLPYPFVCPRPQSRILEKHMKVLRRQLSPLVALSPPVTTPFFCSSVQAFCFSFPLLSFPHLVSTHHSVKQECSAYPELYYSPRNI